MLYPFSKCNDIIDQNENKNKGCNYCKAIFPSIWGFLPKKILKSEHWHTDKGYGGRKPFRYFVTFAMGLK